MKKEWMEEILDKLARENGTTPGKVREQMESYLESLKEGRGEEKDRRVLGSLQRENPDLEEFIGRLAQEMEWEKRKEEELRFYLDGEPVT